VSARPQVFVVADQQKIYTNRVLGSGKWSGWSSFGIPGSANSVADLDASEDSSGRCLLFMVANNGKAFVRFKTSDTTWANWKTIAAGKY
jgi:hypothetical protein